MPTSPDRKRALKTLTLPDLGAKLFCTVPEAAAILGWDVRQVRKGLADGTITGTKTGTTWRVAVAWLRAQAGEHVPRPDSGQYALDLLRATMRDRLADARKALDECEQLLAAGGAR